MDHIHASSLKTNLEPLAAPIPKVQRLHAKGARLVGEILAELGAEHGLEPSSTRSSRATSSLLMPAGNAEGMAA